jgi:glycerophosphoryl diester phosphodiesterase
MGGMTKVIAHRGASRAFPENTVAAFRAAGAMGADMVELDVRATADGYLVIHHDAHLPDGRVIYDLHARELPSDVADLAAAIDACGEMAVNIEVKNSRKDPDFDNERTVAAEVARFVTGRSLHDRVLVSSFDVGSIERVRIEDRNVPTAWLTMVIPDAGAVAAGLVGNGHRALHPYDLLVDAALVETCHDLGLEVNVWTVDDPDRMRELVVFGVDGICTNVPDVALRVLGRS